MGTLSRAVNHADIRIGTLVSAADPAAYIRAILPHGFESFSITFWETNLAVDLPTVAARVREVLAGSGAVISSLSVFGNPLEKNEKAENARRSWERCIDHAAAFGCELVTGFTGRVRGKPLPESIPSFREVFGRLADRAAGKGVRLAFENCPMGGTWNSGDWNIAHSPAAWELMFQALPAAHLGLQWEPCHQLCQLIEPLPQIRDWAKRFFHVHGKDATVRQDVLRKYGIHGPVPYVLHRTPGFGDSDWSEIITRLREIGFAGSIDIEGWHDPVYRDDLEMTGQVQGLNYLKRCRGGPFVANP